MDRRKFLKGAGVLVVGSLRAPKITSSKPVKPSDFNPNDAYGNDGCVSYIPKEDRPWNIDALKKVLYEDMLTVVPEEYRYRVRFKGVLKDFGRILYLAWYYPSADQLPGELIFSDKKSYGVL